MAFTGTKIATYNFVSVLVVAIFWRRVQKHDRLPTSHSKSFYNIRPGDDSTANCIRLIKFFGLLPAMK